jgi:hypothetical protein
VFPSRAAAQQALDIMREKFPKRTRFDGAVIEPVGVHENEDPRAFVDSYLVHIVKGDGPNVRYLHEVPTGGSFVFSEREHATPFDQSRAAELIGNLFPGGQHVYQPVRTEPVKGATNESHPFEDDGLPGEVSSFLRKVRSKRKKVTAKPIL